MTRDMALTSIKEIFGERGELNDTSEKDFPCFQMGVSFKTSRGKTKFWVVGWGRSWEEALEMVMTRPNPLPEASND